MARTEILPIHWGLIKARFNDGTCVPFLGPGVNAPYEGYTGFPPNHEIAFALLKELAGLNQIERDTMAQVVIHQKLQQFKDLTRFGIDDLARVALHFQYLTGSDYLIQRLRELCNDIDQDPSILLALLAKHPFKLIITTNYDRLMEKALNKKYLVISQPDFESQTAARQLYQEQIFTHSFEEDGPILYKFCGTFANGQTAEPGKPAAPQKPPSLSGKQREFLLTNLHSSFSRSDIKEILYVLGKSYDDLDEGGVRAKIVQMLAVLERENKIEALIEEARKRRPGIKWDILQKPTSGQNGQTAVQPQPGTISERILVTEEDFLGILTTVGNRDAAHTPQHLQALLNSSGLLLFLGYRLEGWEFRTIYKTLIEHQDANASRKMIAIQKDPSDFWVDFWEAKGIICYDLDPAGFARQFEEGG